MHVFFLKITDVTYGIKIHPSCFISNQGKAAWLKCKRRGMRLFSAWQPGARPVSFRCSLLSQNPRSRSPFRGCTCPLTILYLQQLSSPDLLMLVQTQESLPLFCKQTHLKPAHTYASPSYAWMQVLVCVFTRTYVSVRFHVYAQN